MAFKVPPKATLPETASTSYWPAEAPPSLKFRLPEFVRLPVMESVPVVVLEPGAIVPLLMSVLTVPTLMVPLPVIVPALVKPPVRVKVAPDATLIVPEVVVEVPYNCNVPVSTFTVPALLRLT